MKCPICNREQPEDEFIDVIYENQLTQICRPCSIIEDVSIVPKPTQEQIKRGDQRYTVRETMMKISGMNKLRTLGPDSPVAVKHLGKINFPEKAQEPSDLIENYNWAIRVARRRKKLTWKQISQIINVPEEILEQVERGILPKNYSEIISLIEGALGIKVTKRSGARLNFVKPSKLMSENEKIAAIEKPEEKKQKIREIERGEFDFSNKKNVHDLTLSDLQKLKKEKDQAKKDRDEEIEEIESMPDDINFDEEI